MYDLLRFRAIPRFYHDRKTLEFNSHDRRLFEESELGWLGGWVDGWMDGSIGVLVTHEFRIRETHHDDRSNESIRVHVSVYLCALFFSPVPLSILIFFLSSKRSGH